MTLIMNLENVKAYKMEIKILKPINIILIYGVIVSVLFTTMALYTWPQLTSDGTRFGYETCIETGREMGKDVCDAWTDDPSYYSPAGEELYAILTRVSILVGIIWFPTSVYQWKKLRTKEVK